MAATEGTASGPLRYRASTAVRPWIHRCLLLVVAGICLLAASGGNPVVAVAGLVGIGAFRRVAYHRTVVELVLDGDRLTLVSGSGRRTTIDLEQLDRFENPTWGHGARLVTTDGASRPLQATGALLPMLDLIDERRPGTVDDVRAAAEKASQTEEKQAARRDRLPWLLPLMVTCTVLGLLLLVGWLAAVVLGGSTIQDRGELVEATVLGIESVDGDVMATVEYEVGSDLHRAEIEVLGVERPEPGAVLVIAVDPEDPDLAWGPGDRPLPQIPWWAVIVGGVLLCASILVAPSALAEHPTLVPVEPDAP